MIKMQESNNLKQVINEALEDKKINWGKIIPSLSGKQRKRHLALLSLLIIYGPKSTWDLAKLYLEKIEQIGLKSKSTFFHKRMKENSIIYKRLKFLESKGYVYKQGRLYYPTIKAYFLLLIVNPRFVSILPLEKFNKVIENVDLEPENEQFLLSMDKMNKPQLPKLVETFKIFFGDPLRAKLFSETFRMFLWSYKINFDEIEQKQFMDLLLTQIRKVSRKIKGSKKNNIEPSISLNP